MHYSWGCYASGQNPLGSERLQPGGRSFNSTALHYLEQAVQIQSILEKSDLNPLYWGFPGGSDGKESESEVAQSCPTLSDPMDCSLSGSSVHGIFQARLEWAATAFSEYLLEFTN